MVIDLICTCNEQTNKKENIRISTENENVENEFQLLVIKISNTHTLNNTTSEFITVARFLSQFSTEFVFFFASNSNSIYDVRSNR